MKKGWSELSPNHDVEPGTPALLGAGDGPNASYREIIGFMFGSRAMQAHRTAVGLYFGLDFSRTFE
ncbi:MAG TPA: hypothetical protein DCZ69_14845 [Syntrophobacteraceae bacterium]|nr:hypothetical protein [Syntrophobacteraceae bacterium]